MKTLLSLVIWNLNTMSFSIDSNLSRFSVLWSVADCIVDRYADWLRAITPRLSLLPDGLASHVNTVTEMALEYSANTNVEEVFSLFAGLSHDLFRISEDAEIMAYAKLYDSPLSDLERENPMLAHGIAAAGFLGQVAPDMPTSIKEAIRYHTLPMLNSTVLTQIVVCADTLEPSRKIPEREIIRLQNISLSDRFKLVLNLKRLQWKGNPS